MDERIQKIRQCADFLSQPGAGDQEIRCLVNATHDALRLGAEILERRGGPPARGHRDLCDLLCERGLFGKELCERLKATFDIAERLPTAWSTVSHDDFERTRSEGARALTAFADLAEKELRAPAR